MNSAINLRVVLSLSSPIKTSETSSQTHFLLWVSCHLQSSSAFDVFVFWAKIEQRRESNLRNILDCYQSSSLASWIYSWRSNRTQGVFFYAMSGNANSNFNLWQLKRQELWWEMVEGSLHLKQVQNRNDYFWPAGFTSSTERISVSAGEAPPHCCSIPLYSFQY